MSRAGDRVPPAAGADLAGQSDEQFLGELGAELAPPLANGELVFEAPWEGRVFAMARSLCEAGHYSWDEFRAALIASIAAWEAKALPESSYRYYDCFLDALEHLLLERGLLEGARLQVRTRELAQRPHGHDHHHEH